MPVPSRSDDDPRPEPPERPANDDCCHCGCDPCIFDLYNEALERWRVELAAWEARRAADDSRGKPGKPGKPRRRAGRKAPPKPP